MIITRHLPEGEPRFTGITVTLNGIPVDPPLCRVSAFPYNTPWPGRQRPLDQTEEAAFLGFEADEPVTLHIRWAHPVRELTVRPLARGVQAVPDGNTATVTLPAPGAYTVEADGYHQALHVFFDPIRDFPAVAQGKAHILSFGPGVHEIGCMDLESDTVVLIDRDAYLYGSFRAVCAENIDILGYGVIDGSREVRTDESRLLLNDYTAPLPADRENILRRLKQRHVLDGILRFYRCRHIRVEGPTLRDAATFAVIPAGCEDVTLENLKTIGMWRYNADGIDLFNCRDVRIRNCFLRNFDDCVVIKGIVGWDTADNADILVEGCVVWCDWGAIWNWAPRQTRLPSGISSSATATASTAPPLSSTSSTTTVRTSDRSHLRISGLSTPSTSCRMCFRTTWTRRIQWTRRCGIRSCSACPFTDPGCSPRTV